MSKIRGRGIGWPARGLGVTIDKVVFLHIHFLMNQDIIGDLPREKPMKVRLNLEVVDGLGESREGSLRKST